MADLQVTTGFFDATPGNDEGWVLRLVVGGTGFVSRALPLVATVGDVKVEALAVMGDGAVGFLRETPPAGARLRIGYADHGMADTDITFGSLPTT